VICWKNFIAIKIKYIVKTFSSQKKFFVAVVINKIFMLNIGSEENKIHENGPFQFQLQIVMKQFRNRIQHPKNYRK